jgi:glutathione S-transferase
MELSLFAGSSPAPRKALLSLPDCAAQAHAEAGKEIEDDTAKRAALAALAEAEAALAIACLETLSPGSEGGGKEGKPAVKPLSAAPTEALQAPQGARGSPVLQVKDTDTETVHFIRGSRAVARFLQGQKDSSDSKDSNPSAALLLQGERDAWVELCDAELREAASVWALTVIGVISVENATLGKAKADVRNFLKAVGDHLSVRSGVAAAASDVDIDAEDGAATGAGAGAGATAGAFLVGGALSYADLVPAFCLAPLFLLVLDPGFCKSFPRCVAWFDAVMAASAGEPFQRCEKMLAAPKKGQKAEPVAAAAAKKAAKPEKPKRVFDMSAWKALHEKSDAVRGEALPWFWDNFEPRDWAIWSAEYGGPAISEVEEALSAVNAWFAHVRDALSEDERADAFASFAVLRTSDSDGGKPALSISGCWMLRGKMPPKSFLEVEDLKTWSMMMLDTADASCRGTVNDHWCWEGKFGGKEFCLGAVFR